MGFLDKSVVGFYTVCCVRMSCLVKQLPNHQPLRVSAGVDLSS